MNILLDYISKKQVELVAVTKLKGKNEIQPLINSGIKRFGENRVLEAQNKWVTLKTPDLKLHLIGHLQSNKTAEAVKLFDVIETIDREKIAIKIQEEMIKQQKFLELLIEVNIGSEPQKTGIIPSELDDFLKFCQKDLVLNIQGLMCIPPADLDPTPFFNRMRAFKNQYNLPILSMGMSDDYEQAINCGATRVRIGKKLFDKT